MPNDCKINPKGETKKCATEKINKSSVMVEVPPGAPFTNMD